MLLSKAMFPPKNSISGANRFPPMRENAAVELVVLPTSPPKTILIGFPALGGGFSKIG